MKAPVKSGGNFEPVPAGNHLAHLYQIIHIGTRPDEYQGQPRDSDKLRLTFELTDERKEFKEGEGEKPFSISQEYTFSMGEKANLRKTVEGLLGTALQDDEAAAFELEDLLGKPCLLNVVHAEAQNGKTYARIKGASPLPKGMTAAPCSTRQK